MNYQFENEPDSGQFNIEEMAWQERNNFIYLNDDSEILRNLSQPQRTFQEATKYTTNQYKTLQDKSNEQPTNNIPTVMGKNFKKYLKYLKKLQNVQIPEQLDIFISKQKNKKVNEKRKSVSFALADFNQFLQCAKSTQFFQFFLKHYAFNYFQQSNKISDPSLMIQYIEYYLASTYQEEPFINYNRQCKKRAKKQVIEINQYQVQQENQDQNNVNDNSQLEQSQQQISGLLQLDVDRQDLQSDQIIL